MSEKCVAATRINQDYCSKCSICYSVCPYEAMKRDLETGEVEVDVQKWRALQNGFDGVMAIICPPQDCKLQEREDTTVRNVTVLKTALKKVGSPDRFELFTVYPRCVGELNQKLSEFHKKIVAVPSAKMETIEV